MARGQDSTSFPGWCQGTNHGDIFILIAWEMNCQQCLLDTQPSDTSAEKKTSKDASHHCFPLIVLTLCILFFFLHKAPVQFLEGRQVTKPSITCRVFITSCPGKMKNDTLQMAFWSLSIIHLTLQRPWQRWLYFIATSETTDLST